MRLKLDACLSKAMEVELMLNVVTMLEAALEALESVSPSYVTQVN
jgi:hypothetical protein